MMREIDMTDKEQKYDVTYAACNLDKSDCDHEFTQTGDFYSDYALSADSP